MRVYLPWCERWYIATFAAIGVVFAGVALGFVADAIRAPGLYQAALTVVTSALIIVAVFLVIRAPYNAYLMWRSLRSAWNRPGAESGRKREP